MSNNYRVSISKKDGTWATQDAAPESIGGVVICAQYMADDLASAKVVGPDGGELLLDRRRHWRADEWYGVEDSCALGRVILGHGELSFLVDGFCQGYGD